jgi:signal transduction histidine kinase
MTMTREWWAAIAAVALVLEGVIAALVGFASFETRQAWLACLTVWITGACGLLAWLRVPGSRTGPLLVIAAVAWGVACATSIEGRSTDPGQRIVALAWAAIAAHAILESAGGRGRAPVRSRIAAVAGYLTTVLPSPLGAATLAAVIIGGLLSVWATISRDRSLIVVASLTLATGVATAAGLLPLGDTPIDPRLAAEASLVVTAVVLSTALVRSAERPRRVETVLLELGPGGGDALTTRLASILDDPRLRIGYWMDDLGRYIGTTGRPMATTAVTGRAITEIVRDGRKVALLEHNPGRLVDGALADAIGRAASLGATNARLQADVERQRAEVDASRRRLAVAADEERRKLSRRLEDILEPRLTELESELENVCSMWSDDAAEASLTHVRDVRRDVAALVAGLVPKALDRGLAVAITELAAASPIPVTVHVATDVPADRLDEAALYFVWSEALANVVKHARASAVDVRLERSGTSVELEIRDDGVGGADAATGTGLLGLRERVEALGGSLAVLSPRGRGTVIRATLPERWPRPQGGRAPEVAPATDRQAHEPGW